MLTFLGVKHVWFARKLVSGTHAISIALFGVLRPGDELLYITGKPYDTLEEIVGIRGNDSGSLKDFGIDYATVPLTDDGAVDFPAIQAAMKTQHKSNWHSTFKRV